LKPLVRLSRLDIKYSYRPYTKQATRELVHDRHTRYIPSENKVTVINESRHRLSLYYFLKSLILSITSHYLSFLNFRYRRLNYQSIQIFLEKVNKWRLHFINDLFRSFMTQSFKIFYKSKSSVNPVLTIFDIQR